MRAQALRRLLKEESFVYMPSAYDAIGGRLVEDLGFNAVYIGGFVTGGSRCTSEPLLTMDEQVRVAGDVANAVKIPAVADGGAGFGEPLHTMRTVREFSRAGVSGLHIEDQLYPKRAHYHKNVAHAIPREQFVDKIKYACAARDETDKDFVIIARTDTCRFEGLEEAMTRLNMAADVGADMGLFFPRNDEEMTAGPKRARMPLVYVTSRGNRDGRPLPTASQLADMGWTDGFAEGSMRPPPRRIVGSSWWDRACCARSPFRKETYHVSITDADDRRHDFVGVGGWYPSHLHRRGA